MGIGGRAVPKLGEAGTGDDEVDIAWIEVADRCGQAVGDTADVETIVGQRAAVSGDVVK